MGSRHRESWTGGSQTVAARCYEILPTWSKQLWSPAEWWQLGAYYAGAGAGTTAATTTANHTAEDTKKNLPHQTIRISDYSNRCK